MTLLHSGVGHQNVIVSVVFSPDGSRVLTGSCDGTAKIWDVHSGSLLQTLSWGASTINAVDWSPDGKYVAVAGWPPKYPLSASQLKRRQDHINRPTASSSAVSDCNSSAPSGDGDSNPSVETRVFNARTGALLKVFEDAGDGVAFSPDGRSLALASWGSLVIVQLSGWRRVAEFQIDNADLRNAFFSEDSKYVACVDSNGVIVFDAATAVPSFIATDNALFYEGDPRNDGIAVRRLPDSPDHIDVDQQAGHLLHFWKQLLPSFRPVTACDSGMGIQRIAFSPTGKLAAVQQRCGFDWKTMRSLPGGITLLDTDAYQVRWFLESPEQKWLRTMAFSPDGKRIAASGDQQEVHIWSMETGQELARIGHAPPRITCLAWSPSTSIIAAGNSDGAVALVEPTAPIVQSSGRPCESSVVDVEFTPDANSLFVASRMGIVRQLKLPSLDMIREFRAHEARLLSGVVSCDGARFVSVGYDEEPPLPAGSGKVAKIVVWSLEDGCRLHSLALPDIAPITSVSASTDHRRLAISFWKVILIADISEPPTIKTFLRRQQASFTRVAFTHDGQHLLVANENYGMKLFKLGEAESLPQFAATRDGPTSLELSHDGGCVVRGTAYSNAIELFELPSGLLIREFCGHQNCVASLALSLDGTLLVSGGADGTLKFWDIKSGELKASIIAPPRSTDSHGRWEPLVND